MAEIKYTSKDYDGFVEVMTSAIPDHLPEWTSRAPGDPGIVLIELFAYVGDILSYYGDRIANEAFLSTATQRRSVIELARLLDYRPSEGVASVGTATFTFTANQGNVTIPAGTRVSTSSSDAVLASEDPVVFTTDVDLTVDTNTVTSGNVGITEGTLVTDEALGNSAGTVDQSFPLLRTPVVEDSVTVKVNGEEWPYFEHLIDADSDESAFGLRVTEDGVVLVLFGDGSTSGAVPPNGATITASYRVGGGRRGNVGANTIIEIVDPITYVESVTNAQATSGGADPESLDSIRRSAPASIRAINRAVTTDDYGALALQVAGVAYASAEASVYTSVTVYVAPQGGGLPASTLKSSVKSFLDQRKMIGTSITMVDPTYADVNIEVDITVQDTFGQSAVKAAVENALSALLAFDNVDFGYRVSLGEVYSAVLGIPGVRFGSVTKLVRSDAGNQNVADDVLHTAGEIPSEGTITVNATGGVV